MRLTERAHAIVATVVRAGDVAIDATAGNGHDTAFLARQVGSTGRVFSFDIQSRAIEATARRLRLLPAAIAARVVSVHASHACMREHLPGALHGRVGCVMFNLGYLPGADHAVTTERNATLCAVEYALALLRPHGVLTVIGYTGHASGAIEVDALEQRVRDEPDPGIDWAVEHCASGRAAAPRLFVASRRKLA